ncbi:MAG: radical SAM/SPASM domain-containing protein [Phycisphaerae bacterium]
MSTLEKKMRDRLSHLALGATVQAAGLALDVPPLRNFFLERLLQRLEKSYQEREGDPERLLHDRWFGKHLQSFLRRLINERPAAARAILRFIGTWVYDVNRRSDAQRAGVATPATVVIEPTDRCNLNCPGCYAKSTTDGCDLPYERLVEIVQEVIDMGVTLVTLSGGEPFLREKVDRSITRLAERFNNRGFLVYTNGTLLDDELAARLGAAGNIFPAISVEGFEHQTDARRGHGIYAQNRRARKLLGDHGVMTGFSATVTRENCEAICTDGFIDLRIEEGDMFGWFFLLQPIGRSPRPDLMVTAEQRATLRETVYRWRQEDRPIFLGDFWNDGPLVGGCMAGGKYYFHIYANGDISPCVFSPVACGNIFDIINGRSEYASLTEFVQRHPVFLAFRDEQGRIIDRARPCLLIDHPEAFRRVAKVNGCRPAKNISVGYLDGEIARAVDDVAEAWAKMVPGLPPLPAERERRVGTGASATNSSTREASPRFRESAA